MFLFAHAIGKSQLESISKSLEREGLKPRTHGNTGKTPKHALSMTDIQRVKHFLNEYAVKFGVPLPGRLPNHRPLKVTLLPSDKTKADIHQIYQEAAKSLNYRVISLSEFKQLYGTVGYHGNQIIIFFYAGGCIFYIFKLNVTVKRLKIKRHVKWLYYVISESKNIILEISKIKKIDIIPLFGRIKQNKFSGCFVSI